MPPASRATGVGRLVAAFVLSIVVFWLAGGERAALDGRLPAGLALLLLLGLGAGPGFREGATWLVGAAAIGRVAIYANYPREWSVYAALSLLLGAALMGILLAAPLARGRSVGGRAARLAIGILVFTSATIAAFGAGEWFVAHHVKERNVYDFAKEPVSRAESIYVPDPLLIRRHRAGYRGRFTHPEYGGELVEINDDGYRDGAWPASMPAGETRVLILGDSNVFGHGLEANETISARMQADIGSNGAIVGKPKSAVRVLNGGVASYGPSQEAIILRELLPRVAPAIVVVVFLDQNDLDDCRYQFIHARQNGRLQGKLASEREAESRAGARSPDEVVLELARRPPLFDRKFWQYSSSLFRLLDQRLGPLLVRVGLADPVSIVTESMLGAMKRAPGAEARDGFELAHRALDDMAAQCQQSGARLLLVRLPAKIQAEPIYFGELLARYALPAAEFDRDLPGSVVIRHCQQNGIATLDLLPILEEPARRSNANYFEEGHLNRAGAARVAQTIGDWLAQAGWLGG